MAIKNPFAPAEKLEKKLKVLVYGPSGAGKTWFGLSFPGRIAVIDMEGGTELYGGRDDVQDFDVMHTQSYADVMRAIDFIEQDGGKTYSTVVIDPITVIWNVLVAAAEQKYMTRAGTISYQGWGVIKRDLKRLYERLTNLPVHIVATAREKTDYSDEGGNLQVVGVKPDAEKSTEYLFDIVVRLEHTRGKRWGVIEKDRSGTLGGRVDNISFSDLAPIANAHQDGKKPDRMSEQKGVEDTAKTLPDATSAPETSAAPEQGAAHWIDNPSVRKRFWVYVKHDTNLTEQEVYEALGTASIHAFEGTMHDAKALIDSYAELKRLDAEAEEPLFPDAGTASVVLYGTEDDRAGLS